MQKIRMTSRKYDGRLRHEYEAFLYAEDEARLVVYAPVGTMNYDRHQITAILLRVGVAGTEELVLHYQRCGLLW